MACVSRLNTILRSLQHFTDNGCLTLNEYKDFGSTPQVLAPAIYKRLNYKQTDCVAVEVVEYTLYPWMDKNGKLQVGHL